MPDTSTEVAIATTTLGSAASTITFSSISGSYTDLRLTIVFKGAAGGTQGNLIFNSDTGSNYSWTILEGDGASPFTQRRTNMTSIYFGDYLAVGTSTTIPEFANIDIFSYAGSTFKTLLQSYSADYNGSGGVGNLVGLWRSTSAITRIDLSLQGGTNFATGTTATLYGIL